MPLPNRAQMVQHGAMRSPMFLLAPLLGCGEPVMSAPALESLLGNPVPAEPAWNLRWLVNGGIQVDCRVEQLAPFSSADIVLGEVQLPPPEVAEAAVWSEESELGYRYALALFTLVDEEQWEQEEVHGVVPDLPGALDHGTWGVSETYALLFVDGDLDAASAELLVGDADEGQGLPAEVAWVKWLPQIVTATLNPENGLLLPSEAELDAIERLGITVTSRRYLSVDAHDVASGAALNSATLLEGC